MATAGFRPAWWLPGGNAQTLWPVLTRRVNVETRTEVIELPDGDFTQLDWLADTEPSRSIEATPNDSTAAAPNPSIDAADTRPIVVLLPGLQGDLNSQYIRGMMVALSQCGWRAVLLNHRGRPEPNRFAHSYHCGFTDDLDHLVAVLHARYPDAPLAVVGFSLGANICLKWLGAAGRAGRSLPIVAAVGVCVPFHLGVVARRIERGFSRLYQNRMLNCLKSDVRRKLRQRAAAGLNTPLDVTERELDDLNTFYRFDDRLTAPMHGFADAADYYERNRTDHLIAHVAVPTLIVNADDDPLIPVSLIPEPTDCSDAVQLEVSRSGGHMGFVAGPHPARPHYWLDDRIPAFLRPFFHPVNRE